MKTSYKVTLEIRVVIDDNSSALESTPSAIAHKLMDMVEENGWMVDACSVTTPINKRSR